MNTALLMEKIIEIEAANNTPYIYFNPAEGNLKIEGNSHLNDPKIIFGILNNAIENYVKKPLPVTSIYLYFKHIDSVSQRQLFATLHPLMQLAYRGYKIRLRWDYDQGDDDTLDMIKDFQAIFKYPIEINEIDDE